MRKFLFVIIGLFALSATIVGAQASSGSKLVWEIQAASLAEAQAFTYKVYADSSTTGQTMTSVTCTGTTAPFTCSNNFPTFTPGNHTLTITASNLAGESGKSVPLNFTFVVTPGVPVNLRIG
jgi:hypothetical protein